MFFTRLTCLSALLAVASAHFQLTYPPSRGFIENDEPQEPCGGFNNVTARTPFPLGSTYIKLASEHEQANVRVMISFVSDPTDIKNFTQTSSGQDQAPIRDWFQVDGEDICIGVDISSIGYPSANNGTNATIAVLYQGGDGSLYQCADVVLSSSATVPSNVSCSNEYSTTALGTGTSTASPSATTAHNGAGHLGAGIGALVTLFGSALYLL